MRGRVPARASHLSERVYGALLVAYPKRFRDEYGPEMARAFRDILREERLRGAAWPVRLWARALPDLAASAFAERREDVVSNSEEVAVKPLSQRRHYFNLISPVVFLGGLALALVLNAPAVLRVGVAREDGELVGTARLRLKPWNMVEAATSCLLLVILVGYVFLENFAGR